MIGYIVKRVLLFIPALFLVSLLAFYISINAPGDPVEILSQPANAQGANAAITATRQYKDSVRVQLGLNLPLFYFSWGTANDCDTLYKVFDRQENYALYRLSRQYGHWPLVSNYYKTLKALPATLQALNADSIYAAWMRKIQAQTNKDLEKILDKNQVQSDIDWTINIVHGLPAVYQSGMIQSKIDSLQNLATSRWYLRELQQPVEQLKNNFEKMRTRSGVAGNLIPSFSWHGTHNQYHHWLSELLKGNFGYSYQDQQPIAEKIWPKFLRSFTLVFLSVLIAYLISIPIGLYSAQKQGGFLDRFSALLFFMLYSIPAFFAGTILLYFFANPEYFSWFPESGYCDPEHYNAAWSFWQKVYYTFPYMVLPLITYTYASFAFISRIVRSAAISELEQDYIRTARAKGLTQNQVLWKHAARNVLLPVITTFVNIFPAATAGSVIIESIFSYDGMGISAYEAVLGRDYPFIVCIFTLAGLMSMIAYLVADILYVLADPRIRLKQK